MQPTDSSLSVDGIVAHGLLLSQLEDSPHAAAWADLQAALSSHQRGELDRAEALYRQVLVSFPDQPDSLHMLGVIEAQRGRPEKAVELIRHAISIAPDNPLAHNNCGNALRALQRYDEALSCYDRAVALRPSYPEALYSRGLTLRDLHRHQEASEAYEKAIVLRPADPVLHVGRGNTLSELKRRDEAIASYRQALACGGDQALIRYYLAALGAEDVPPIPPQVYVEGLFDQYATRFDEALDALDYRVPEQLFKTILDIDATGDRDIADLGCGTGMCGTVFRRLARSIVGVDLSANMLEESNKRAVYDRLVKADLVEFLNDHPNAFDLIIAADVFIYVGALEAVFAATRKALRSGGQLAFSVESDKGVSFSLRESRRYAHSLPYLQQLAADNGFVERAISPVTIRLSDGVGIAGHNIVFELAPSNSGHSGNQ